MRETDFPNLRLVNRGKVRDIYDLGDRLLIVATDRISAFDCVLPTPIPEKGRVLNSLSAFWFRQTSWLIENHLITTDMNALPDDAKPYAPLLTGRAMLTKKAIPLPVECVVRGYLAGSAWREYRETGAVCGIELPPGLQEGQELDKPIFTPATKAAEGHDENVTEQQIRDLLGNAVTDRLKEVSLAIYRFARDYARDRGVIIADTKFEFGYLGEKIILIDEVLTPDSSRFWPAENYRPGRPQPSFDKQYVRDYLESIGWDKQPPAPELPPEVVEQTRIKYREAFRRLTGEELPPSDD